MVTTELNFKKFTEGKARKFTVSFAFCAHVDVTKIEIKDVFLRARADYLSLCPMHLSNRKTIGSHLNCFRRARLVHESFIKFPF